MAAVKMRSTSVARIATEVSRGATMIGDTGATEVRRAAERRAAVNSRGVWRHYDRTVRQLMNTARASLRR